MYAQQCVQPSGTNGRGLDLTHASSTQLDGVNSKTNRRFQSTVASLSGLAPIEDHPGDASGEAPPVPIPNTEVKLSSAEDTRGATPWENRSSPGFSFHYPQDVDRICPFLALATDHRTAVDGYDADHACHAMIPPEALDRARQAELCLSEAHRQCDRYLAFLAAHAADSPDVPTPSVDALIARTRLVVEPDARRVPGIGEAPMGLSARRWAIAGGVALVGVAAAATAVAGGFGSPAGRGTDATPSPTASPTMTATPSASELAEPSPEPSTSQAAEPTPRPTRSAAEPTATPAQTTYVVQEGDTLNGIAVQFGTTAEAIRQANGLPSDVINIGQVLVIP